MDTGEALLAAIPADPADDTRRLAYADWLEEREARWVDCPRCGGEPRRYFDKPPLSTNWARGWRNRYTCAACDGTGTVRDDSDARRAEFIRVQVELARHPEQVEWLRQMPIEHWRGGGDEGKELRRLDALLRRERELFHTIDFPDLGYDKLIHGLRVTRYELDKCELPAKGLVSRGFVSEVRLPCAAFTRDFAARLFGAMPVERVVWSDFEPEEDRGEWRVTMQDPATPVERRLPRSVPANVWAHVPKTPGWKYNRWFATRDDALAALSAAACAWGREVAGLVPAGA